MIPHRTTLVVAVSLFLPVFGGSIEAADDTFDPGATVRTAVSLMEREHFARKPLDNELSRKWLHGFIDRLDPNRMYFLESDLHEFQRYEDRLDDLADDGDFQFPQLVRKRYRTRTKEAVSNAEEFLSVEHDYSVNEDCPIRFDAYVTKPEQLRERWRLRIKAELLIEKLHGRQRSDVKSQLYGRYQRISRQAREMTDERLCQIYLDSLAAIYDPHSAYLSPTLLASFNQTVTIRTYNLGLGLRQRAGQFVIVSLHPSLRDTTTQNKLLGWSLIAVRRLNGATFDLVEMHPEDLHHMIRWPFGPLESDTEIILELLNPVTYERVTVSWNRFPSF